MLCGTRPFVERARRMRKLLGGGMRQVGVIAAAGIVALDEMVDRLAEDHAHARRLAAGLAALPGVALREDEVESNFVFFSVLDAEGRLTDGQPLIAAAAAQGVLISTGDQGRLRCATHSGIVAADVDRALEGLERAVRGLAPARV
jgi:threonine aldolase